MKLMLSWYVQVRCPYAYAVLTPTVCLCLSALIQWQIYPPARTTSPPLPTLRMPKSTLPLVSSYHFLWVWAFLALSMDNQCSLIWVGASCSLSRVSLALKALVYLALKAVVSILVSMDWCSLLFVGMFLAGSSLLWAGMFLALSKCVPCFSKIVLALSWNTSCSEQEC